jgi:hypothetical protein
MPSAGFEPATPATKRPQTYGLDLAATEVDYIFYKMHNLIVTLLMIDLNSVCDFISKTNEIRGRKGNYFFLAKQNLFRITHEL